MNIYSNRRNLVRIYASEKDIVSILDWKKPGFLELPVLRGSLPDGTRIVGVGWDPDRCAFGLACYHPGFPEVLDGDIIPLHPAWRDAKVETVEVVFDQAGPDEPLRVTIPGSAP